MRKLLFFFIIISANTIFSQTITDTLFSAKLNEDREIKISLPPSYKKNTAKKYPILVILDGDFLHNPFEGALKYGNYWDDLPEVIIVSVSQNKNKERETDCMVDGSNGLPMEKGEQFFEFIGAELLPAVQKKYRCAPFKIIAGLDTTAGFLNFYLYKENPVFDAYISISPELPMGMEEQIPERLMTIQKPVFYYTCSANGDTKSMQERIKTLAETTKKISSPKFNFRYETFEGSHYSSALYAIPNALYQIFSVYQPISTNEFQEKIAILQEGYVDYLINKYDVIEKTLGLKTQIRLKDFKAIEAAILKNKAYNEFDLLAQLAEKNYPKTMLADYEMAVMYEKKGNLKSALKSYQNAYQLKEIGDLTKDMMIDKVDELTIAVKNEKKKPQEVIQETPTEIQSEVPAEAPTEAPTQEIKQQ